MEKIVFGNNEFELTPMGIFANEATKRRGFKFTTELTYQEVEDILINPENYATIKFEVADNVVATYADCVSLKTLGKDIETGIYTAEFSTDVVERRMAELEAEIEVLKAK